MANTGRFYFYTMDGQEIEPGFYMAGISGGGAAIAKQESNGDWVKKMFKHFKGVTFAREEITIFTNSKLKERDITIADFPEHEAVVVKEWWPNEDAREWFVLTAKKDGEDLACNVPFIK